VPFAQSKLSVQGAEPEQAVATQRGWLPLVSQVFPSGQSAGAAHPAVQARLPIHEQGTGAQIAPLGQSPSMAQLAGSGAHWPQLAGASGVSHCAALHSLLARQHSG
jgi:hypothetical protein